MNRPVSDLSTAGSLRPLGRQCGLRVSALSVGTWLTFGSRLSRRAAAELVAEACEAGVVLFDTAAGYGPSEAALGRALGDAGVDRDDVAISTKMFPRRTLARKHLRSTMQQSLERLGVDSVDVITCHRNDPDTPLPEVVHTMSEFVTSGLAHYWGTSFWTVEQIRAARAFAEANGLHPPVCAQPGYSLGQRRVVEVDYAPLAAEGHGLMTFSPVGFGLLSGRYVDGVPAGSRATERGLWLADMLPRPDLNERVRRVAAVAAELGMTPAQLAVAWALGNPAVQTVITAPESVAELRENLAAVAMAPRLTPELRARAEAPFEAVEIMPGDPGTERPPATSSPGA